MSADVSIGVPGALGPDVIGALAHVVEAAGFAGLWVNDTPEGDPLTALASAARATGHLRLATGVVPVDRRPATEILAAVDRLRLPTDRLTIGIGSGRERRGSVDRVTEAVTTLRVGTAAAIVVGALGPRMRRLGVTAADGVLLSWLPADLAADQAADLRAAGQHAGGRTPRVALYVRTVVDEAARPALEIEVAQYASCPQYAANFQRLGIRAADTVLPNAGEDLQVGLSAYRAAVDEVVLRAITPNGTFDELTAFVERAARFISKDRRPTIAGPSN